MESSGSWREVVVPVGRGSPAWKAVAKVLKSLASTSKGNIEETKVYPLDGSEPREMFGELWDVRSRVRYSLHPQENRMMVHSRATGDIDFTVIKRVTGLWGLMEDAAAGGGD